MTRAAISKRLCRLRADGLALASQPGRGYRLLEPLELFETERIIAALPPHARELLAELRIEGEIDSTNSALQRAANDGAPSGTACLAERQIAGRGRRGRRWLSPPARNVYLSILWRFEHGLSALGGLSVAMGVAAGQALRALGAGAVQLKWPNDLSVARHKVGGLLVDAAGEWAGPCHAVIGIGINLRMPAQTTSIDQPWTDLSSCIQVPPGRNALAAELLAFMLPALERFADHGLRPFMQGFAALDALAGQSVRVHGGGIAWDGVADGLAPDGRLRVRTPDGELCTVSAAEVSIRRTIDA